MSIRHQQILEQLNAQGKVNVNQLAEQLSVSVETIRRDLTALHQQGLLYRTHGGAVSRKAQDIGSSFQARHRIHYEAKRHIAEAALTYVYEGAVIGLDASSSSWHFAQLLPNIPCTIVTNSMHNITALVNKTNVTTIATGGMYSSKYDAFYGPLSEQLLLRLHIDIGIFSCTGIDLEGNIWESNELNASIKRKIMDASGQKFIFADHSKINRKNLIKLAELSQMDILFTDQNPAPELYAYCEQHNVLLTV